MYRTIEQWCNILKELCAGTEYEAVMNGGEKSNKSGVAIVPIGSKGPQRICVYPKKTVGPGLAIEMDVYRVVSSKGLLADYDRLHGNRPHYNRLTDEEVLRVCKIFLGKA